MGWLASTGCGRLGFDASPPTDARDPDVLPRRVGAADIGPGSLACAVAEGRLFCWGLNDVGQTGTGLGEENVLSPIRIGSDSDWATVDVGQTHVCALKGDQTLWCWGVAESGALGLANVTTSAPAIVANADGESWVGVAAGWDHTCAVSSDTKLWCWGANVEGQIAQPDPFSEGPGVPRFVPTQVETEIGWSQVSSGQGHSCGLRDDELFCWGRNSKGQLGLGPNSLGQSRIPNIVGAGWRDISTSASGTCGIRQDQTLWCWGDGSSGLLGQGTLLDSDIPIQVETESDWIAISLSSFHTCGIRADNTLWCWGRSIEGQLSNDMIDDVLSPIAVAPTQRWKSVSASRFETCGVDVDDVLWCTGANAEGQLGIGSVERPYVFTALEFLAK